MKMYLRYVKVKLSQWHYVFFFFLTKQRGTVTRNYIKINTNGENPEFEVEATFLQLTLSEEV